MSKDTSLIDEVVEFGREVMRSAKKDGELKDKIQALNAMAKLAALKYDIEPEAAEGSKLDEYRKNLEGTSSRGKSGKHDKEAKASFRSYDTSPAAAQITAQTAAAKAGQNARNAYGDERDLPHPRPPLDSFAVADSGIRFESSSSDTAGQCTVAGSWRV